MRVVLDTNILLLLARNQSAFASFFQESVLPEAELVAVSVVSMGELSSLALRNQWGEQRMARLTRLMDHLLLIPVESQELVAAYARLDVYSQGKWQDRPLPAGMSSRNMGKNDLWIAATAWTLGATLLTTDPDFAHLSPLMDIRQIKPE